MEEFDEIIKRLNEIEKYNGIWGVVITIVLVIGFILLWKFLTTSIEKKAVQEYDKRLEDFKADLQEKIGTKLNEQQGAITKEISKYQSELDKDLSKLTAELEISNAKKIEVKNEERKAIVDYLDSYSSFLYGALQVQILDYKYKNYEDVNTKLEEINKAYAKTNIAWNKMKFWTTNDDIIQITHDLNTKMLELSHFTQSKLGSLRHNLTWGKMYTDSFQKVIKDLESHKEYAEFLASEDKRIREENDKIYKEYWDGKLEIWSEVMKINGEFQKMAKEYLNEIDKKAST